MSAGRMLIAAAGVAVVLLIAFLLVSTRGGPSPIPNPNPNPTPAPTPTPTPPPTQTPKPVPPPPPAPAPARTATLAADAGEDVVIREHHDDSSGPVQRTHSAATFAAIRKALIPIANGCGDALTSPPDGRVQVIVNATIRTLAGRITASDVTVDGADVLGAAYATCVAQAVSALDLAAPAGQPDGEDLVHMPFSVP